MVKILKGKPLPHIMIVDTNILWHEDKGPAVCPDFDIFWADHKQLVEIELVVPEVVRGELLFQQFTSCSKLLDKVNELVSEMSSITVQKHRHRTSKETLLAQVTAKIDKWVNSKDARMATVPVSAIDWEKLCNRAIWRTAPFTFDPKNAKNEKGFRDSLIYETVVHLVTNESRTVNIAFVCNDFLLRATVTDRLKGDQRFACYESLVDFSSYIKLTREKLTNEFIKKITIRAAEKFYTKDDPNSLWVKEKILEQMEKDLQSWRVDELAYSSNLPLMAVPIGVASAAPLTFQTARPDWEPAGGYQGYLGPYEFQKISGTRTYHWKTGVVFFRKYVSTKAPSGESPSEMRVHVVHFSVSWKANVKDDARFHDMALEGLKFDGKEFRVPTEEEKKKYKLDDAQKTA